MRHSEMDNKNTIKIKIHSLVDVITNSSTTIYVQCHDNTIKYAKELIDIFLQATGSNKKADDLFTFNFDVDREIEVENIVDDPENYLDSDYLEKALKLVDKFLSPKQFLNKEYSEQEKIVNKILDLIANGDLEPYEGYGECNDYDQRELIIKAKNDTTLTLKLTEKFKNIFEINEG